MEDRPQRIKVLLFPYHDVDVETALSELETAGFLARYTVDNKRYIHIVNFLKHQKPHPREADSVIPSHEKVSPRRTKARPSREKETKPSTQEIPCQTQPGGLGDLCLGDLGSSVNGSGNGLGDRGSGDSVGTGASAASEKSKQQNFDIWQLGVGKLMATGTDEPEARSFLGGMRQRYGNDLLSEAITKMLAQNPVDPKTYLVAILQGRNGTRPGMSKVDKSMAAARQVIEEYEHGN